MAALDSLQEGKHTKVAAQYFLNFFNIQPPSSATQHVACNKVVFTNLGAAGRTAVYLANGLSAPIEGKGEARVLGIEEPLKKCSSTTCLACQLSPSTGTL